MLELALESLGHYEAGGHRAVRDSRRHRPTRSSFDATRSLGPRANHRALDRRRRLGRRATGRLRGARLLLQLVELLDELRRRVSRDFRERAKTRTAGVDQL